MKRDDLLRLAEAVEKLSGPDRRTDYLVMTATVRPGKGYLWDPADNNHQYTCSIDAAMSLVPKGWQCDRAKWWAEDGASVELIGSQWDGESWVHHFNDGRVRGDAFNPALALCAAALRAQAEALA